MKKCFAIGAAMEALCGAGATDNGQCGQGHRTRMIVWLSTGEYLGTGTGLFRWPEWQLSTPMRTFDVRLAGRFDREG